MTASSSPTVGELVRERPARARVFDRFHIDYCCGGGRPLAEACARAGADAAEVQAALAAFDATAAADTDPDLGAMPLPDLLDAIEASHHAYLKDELPRLSALATKVANRHGERHPRLGELSREVQALAAELLLHLRKEEEVLFPWIRTLCAGGDHPLHCGGDVSAPISVMEAEHETTGAALARIRELTDDFTPLPEACNSWRALYAGLEQLVADTHRHIHKENCVVHPRALALAAGATRT